jgi:polyhydroxyalkanoate synthase
VNGADGGAAVPAGRAEPTSAMGALEDLRYGLDLSGQDPAAIGEALWAVVTAALRNPDRLLRAGAELALDQSTVAGNALRRYAGAEPDAIAAPLAGDKRFGDPAWQQNPMLRAVVESYVLTGRWWIDLVDEAGLPDRERRKARFGVQLLLDAMAPSNVPWLNPSVVKAAVDSGGLSLVRGFATFVEDMARNQGRPRQVDTSPFELGRNLGATPGRVVYRNELIELLAFEPQTEKVFEVPLLCSPPWINKYYVMDLAPGRSFIEHAVRNGFQVFTISYRNPDESMAEMRMDDYLRLGLLAALDLVPKLTGSPTVNLFSLCLGGTLSGMALAYLTARGQGSRVGAAAFTNTLLDFSEPGDLGIFTDESTIARLEERMRRRGYLESSVMASTFDWLRGNDLVWSYVVSNWYMGRKPPPFDILTWNGDSTNMPCAMHSQYLRTCYLENRLAEGRMEVEGTRLDLAAVKTPVFVLGAEADHIAPWRSTYRTTQLFSGEARFTLTSSGHIAGIVNPPGNPKARHWTREDCPPDPDEWRAGATEHQGSWWDHWVPWAAERSGATVDPPSLPKGEPAPGRYVHNQSGPPVPGPARNRRTRPAAAGKAAANAARK